MTALVAWAPPEPLDHRLLDGSELASELTDKERHELTLCESAIKKGFETFLEVGKALKVINDSRLYREKYKDFESYCRVKWQFNRAHAYRQIGAAKTIEALSPIGDKGFPLPTHESQVRPLVGLEPKAAQDAWVKALEVAKNRPVTAKDVQNQLQLVKKRTKKAKKSKSSSGLNEKEVLIALDALDRLKTMVASTEAAERCLKEIEKIRKWIESI